MTPLQFQSHADTIVPPGQAGAALAWKAVTLGLTFGFESQQSPPTVANPAGGVVRLQRPMLADPTP